MMNVFRIAVVVLMVLFLTAGTGFAKTAGFYLGGSIGQGTLDFTDGEKLTTDNVGYKLFAGYRLKFLAVEGGYVDFGNMSNGVPVDAKTTGWDLFGVLNFALGPVDLFGKLGAIAWDIDAGNFKDTDTDLAYGIGAAIRLGPFSVRGEYERFDIAKTDAVGMYSLGLAFMF